MRTAVKIALGLAAFLALGVVLTLVAYLAWRFHANKTGAQKLQDTLADLRAAGDPTDYSELIPPPISPGNNLAAIDLFRLEYVPAEKTHRALRLKAALENISDSTEASRLGSFINGKHLDREEFAKFLSDKFHQSFPPQTPPASLLDQFDQLCPALAELRDAAASRSDCCFERDYTTQPPWDRPLGDITELLPLSKVLQWHAIAALRSGQPAVALQDIDACLILDSSLRKEPILVSGLVGIGVFAIQEQAIWEGLEDHSWNDAQLAELQQRLAGIDFFADSQLCLRGEALGYIAPILDYLKKNQRTTASLFLTLEQDHQLDTFANRLLWRLCPPGEFDRAKARVLDLEMRAARESIDLKAHEIFPGKCAEFNADAKNLPKFPPPMLLASIAVGPILNASLKFSQAQFKADAARMACMIERYRLAHGQLPKSLNDLADLAKPNGLPTDPYSGESYRYRLRDDGTYLLYSVGQNGIDDNGTVVNEVDGKKDGDHTQGDLVWPQPGHPGT